MCMHTCLCSPILEARPLSKSFINRRRYASAPCVCANKPKPHILVSAVVIDDHSLATTKPNHCGMNFVVLGTQKMTHKLYYLIHSDDFRSMKKLPCAGRLIRPTKILEYRSNRNGHSLCNLGCGKVRSTFLVSVSLFMPCAVLSDVVEWPNVRGFRNMTGAVLDVKINHGRVHRPGCTARELGFTYTTARP